MENTRPVLNLPKTQTEKTLDILAFLLILTGWGMVYIAWERMSGPIPVHFGLNGAPDHYGSKTTLLFLNALGTLIAIGLTFMARFPHKFNYPTAITAENAETEYRKARLTTTMLKTLTASLFVYITHTIIDGALNGGSGLGWGFAVIIGLLLLIPVYLLFGRK